MLSVRVLSALWILMSTGPLLALAAAPLAERQTLIVLLDAESRGAPQAEEVVREVNGGGPAPGDLPLGRPLHADFGLTRRAQGSVRAWLRNHPDGALARLHRYVVLEYPAQANLGAIAEALRHHPHVIHVEIDVESEFSAGTEPNDPFLVFDPNPVNYQWGHDVLNVPAAWQLTGGHGYIGLADSGIQVDHPDLRAFHQETVNNKKVWVYDGGNVRTHLAWDFADNDADVDELGPGPDGTVPDRAGHGTHIAGLIAATADNSLGGTGVCLHCSVVPNKFRAADDTALISALADAVQSAVQTGVQVQSLSLGSSPQVCSSTAPSLLCSALDFAAERDVMVVAASGNDRTDLDFPASDARVVAVGGMASDTSFWDEFPNCPIAGLDKECGSNFGATPGGPQQDLVAPAKSVLSTMYEGREWAPSPLICGDSHHSESGYGPCTGTSMSAPYVAGIAGLLRSVNPLLPESKILRALLATASLGSGSTDPKLGYGYPDAEGATQAVLGFVGGESLNNRLTPLFSLYSPAASTHFYTTVPQMASAAIFDCQAAFVSEGLLVSSYPRFPGVTEEPCPFSGCEPILPRAAVYLFTAPTAPFEDAPALVPLYRMSYDPDFAIRCREGIEPPAQVRRGFFYTTDETVLPSLKASGYELDGREGYVFGRCEPEPECIPVGAVRLYRLYHPGLDDYVIFPEDELAAWQAAGYASVAGLNDWIGYAFPNQDSDFDGVIDAFERLVGIDPARADSDCDGTADGEELLEAPFLDLYGDPADGPCPPVNSLAPIFSDNFEQGDLAKWNLGL